MLVFACLLDQLTGMRWDTHNNLLFDETTQRYWSTGRGCMNPTCAVSYAANANNKQLRSIALTSASPSLRPTDFTNAHLVSQPQVVRGRGVGDDQLYLQVTFAFHDVYIGLLSVFNQSSDTVSCQLQWTDRLALNTTFVRIQPGTPLIDCDTPFCRGMCHPAAFPVQPDSESDISMYYWGTVGQHNVGVQHGFFNLAHLRPDGFAGMQAAETGFLRSQPLLCTGKRLIVSADPILGSTNASICVGLLNVASSGLADCIPVVLAGEGGVSDHAIRWRGGRSLPVGQMLTIEFKITHATIFTFGFDSR